LHAFMPGGAGYTPDGIDRLIASPQARADFLGRGSVPATINAFFGSQLFAHNTRVGLLAFATGMLGGVPTVLLHLYNGIVLGAFFAAGLVAAPRSVRRFSRRVPVDAAWLGELIAPVRGGSPGSGSAPRP